MCDFECLYVLLEQLGTVEHELKAKPPFYIPWAFPMHSVE